MPNSLKSINGQIQKMQSTKFYNFPAARGPIDSQNEFIFTNNLLFTMDYRSPLCFPFSVPWRGASHHKSSRPKDFSSRLTQAQEVAQIEAKDILNLGKILPGQTNSQILRNLDPRGKNTQKSWGRIVAVLPTRPNYSRAKGSTSHYSRAKGSTSHSTELL